VKTTRLTEIGILVSLAVVLEVIFTGLAAFIPVLALPYGGRISLSMLPLFIITYRHGVKAGVVGGIAYGVLNLMLDGVLYHWASLFLDYIFAFGAIGLGGLVFLKMEKNVTSFTISLLIGAAGRFVFSYLSGAIIFAMILGYMDESFTNPWLYSLVYNLYYILPSAGLSLLVGIPLILKLELISSNDSLI
jgi:thiamine transporter